MKLRPLCIALLITLTACSCLRAEDARETGRRVFYLPAERATANADPVRTEHLFKQAEQAAAAGREAEAFGLLHRILSLDANHVEANRLLGRSPTTNAKKIAVKAVTQDHARFGWRRGRHWRVESRHFLLETDNNTKEATTLVQSLEMLHDVWRQMYYTAWAKPGALAARFKGETEELAPHRTFQIVLFKDREEYVRQLGRGPANAQVSSGIYLDEEKKSIYFAGPEAKRSTWYHEATHQFFQEYQQAPPGAAKSANAWLVEAAALYMESLAPRENFVTLGGWDTENLQFARFRIRGGDFQMPLAELSKLGREDLQRHPDIRRIYSETAGLGHFLLDGERSKYEPSFVATLLAIYHGRGTPEMLAQRCETSYTDLDKGLYAYLDVTDDLLQSCPPRAEMTSLSLRNTRVTDIGMAAFAKCDRPTWIDLSLTSVGDAGLAHFPENPSLKQLFLERTKISDVGLASLARFPNLEELYLSATTITDDGLAAIASLKKLKTLDMSGCHITDVGLTHLTQSKQLETLATEGTSVTREGLLKLKKTSPKLIINDK